MFNLSYNIIGIICMHDLYTSTHSIYSFINILLNYTKDQTDAERAALHKCENASYLQLYHELSLLRLPLQFDILVGTNLQYENSKDKSKVQLVRSNNSTKSAISSYVMRSGVHYVEFPNLGGFMQSTSAGIMRPVDKEWHRGKEKKTKKAKAELINQFDPSYLKKPLCAKLLGTKNEKWGDGNVHCCMLSSGRGCCSWSNWEGGPPGSATWDGQAALDPWAMIEAARSNNPRPPAIPQPVGGPPTTGLKLDLDEGTLTAYKNGHRLGVMMSGLTGEYVWVATLHRSGTTASIRRAPIPADSV